MDTKLPEGWVEVTLGEIAEWGSGGTPSRAMPRYYDGDIPWIKTGDLNDSLLENVEEYISEEGLKKSSAKIFPKGSVAVAMYGATIGKTALLGIDAATNQACAVAQPRSGIDNRYLFFYIQSQKKNFIDKGKGGAQPNISQTIIKAHPFPLAPYQEQKRITDKLDNLYHHLDLLNERLDKIPELLKQFRENVLTQAMNRLPTAHKTLDEITLIVTDGDHQAPPKTETGIPFIVISNISNGTLDLSRSTRFVPNTYFEEIKEYRKPQFDDILYTVTGSIGIPVLVDTNKPFSFQRHIGLIRPDKRFILPKFLFYALKSSNINKQALNAATGTAQLTIPLSGIRKFFINCPPLEEQRKIVKKIDTLFSGIERVEAFYENVKMKMETFPFNLLAKAFRGELVDQHPDDEPASSLLQKITQMKTK